MAVLRFKGVQNYRGAPVRTSTPEPFDISGGVALLAEAPADPSTYPVTVTVNGQARTRVTTAPGVGQFRVMTQTVIGSDGQGHNEYLPLLQFNASDDGLSGSCDYWQNGTVLTSQFFDVLLAFLTPLTGYSSLEALPQATMASTLRGRPGDIAFLSSGEMAFSDGSSWRLFSGSTPSLSGGLPLGTAIALALDSGYVGPSLTDSQSFDGTHGFDANAVWTSLNSWAGDLSLDAVLGLTTDAVAAHAGAADYAAAYALALDAAAAHFGALSLAGSFSVGPDASYSAAAAGPALIASFPKTTSNNAAYISSIASPAFSTSQGSVLLVAALSADSDNQTITASIAGHGLTWTQRAISSDGFGPVAIWTAWAPAALSSGAVTVTFAGAQPWSASLAVYAYTGASQTLGAKYEAASVLTSATVSITAQAADSAIVFAVKGTGVAGAGVFTAVSGSTKDLGAQDPPDYVTGIGHRTSNTTGAGAVTVGFAEAMSGGRAVALEVLKA